MSASGSSIAARDLERGVDRPGRRSRRCSMPSSIAMRRVVRKASLSETVTQRSTIDAVERLGPEVLADALDEVRLDLVVGVDRADRVGADDLDRRVHLLEVAPGAGDRAARADAGDEVRDLPGGLLPQLRAGRRVVRGRVGLVEVLVGLERAGDLLGEPVGDAVVGLAASRARRRSARRRPRRRRRAGGRSSPSTSCPA